MTGGARVCVGGIADQAVCEASDRRGMGRKTAQQSIAMPIGRPPPPRAPRTFERKKTCGCGRAVKCRVRSTWQHARGNAPFVETLCP